jgi:glutamine amidotransferase/cyclase
MLTKRIIPCLDVRLDDQGRPVVTKGHQYDVRQQDGKVRDLGDPISMAKGYDEEGADELIFLDITRTAHGRSPLLDIIAQVSDEVFLPLTIGGGIRGIDDAHEYFHAGADKVSLGSNAVEIVLDHLEGRAGKRPSAIDQIAKQYGSQACVISIDPKRVYVPNPEDTSHRTIQTKIPGPQGECFCWFQCSVRGGRTFLDVDAITLARVTEDLGAGEILLNSIDRDGTRSGFDIELVRAVSENVHIPVIASSGAGTLEHFAEVLTSGKADAALAASLFHYGELSLKELKAYLSSRGVPVRLVSSAYSRNIGGGGHVDNPRDGTENPGT